MLAIQKIIFANDDDDIIGNDDANKMRMCNVCIMYVLYLLVRS